MALRVKLSIFYHSFQHHVHYFDKFFGSDVGEVEQISTLRIGDIFLQFQIFGNTAQQILVALPQFTSAMNKGNGKEYNSLWHVPMQDKHIKRTAPAHEARKARHSYIDYQICLYIFLSSQ